MNKINSYGYWKVTTEGDVEGRTINHLGTYEGHIDEIAFALANKCMYSLRFEAAPKLGDFPKNRSRKEVCISFDIGTGTWDMSMKERQKFFSEILKDRPVVVDQSTMFASVKLIDDTERVREKLRQSAIEKLTPEEIEALGL